jgi:hypothetical protein
MDERVKRLFQGVFCACVVFFSCRIAAISMGSQRQDETNSEIYTMCVVRTSQMNVQRSCHVAFFGRSLREAVVATTAMPATAASENADVAVKTGGAA